MGGHSDNGESSCEDAKAEKAALDVKFTGSYKCSYDGCGATFKKPSRLKQHTFRHTGERPFECDRPNCSRAYTNASHLRRHIAVSHQNSFFQAKLRCSHPECNLLLSNEHNLKRHYRRVHEKSNACKECGKVFKKHQHLRAHMNSHAETPPFRCTECNIGFTSNGMLKKHQRCHKKHACNVKDCKEVFQKWSQLRHHWKVAHPLEYICDVCGKKFNHKGNISCHVATHMPDRPSFPCPYPDCERSYVRKCYLFNHIKWYHEGKGVMCTHEGCKRMICTKARWIKHMAWHEKDHTLPSAPRRGNSRKPRFDKGAPRRSMATTLAGIPALPLCLEKKIISGTVLDSEEDLAIKDLSEVDLSIEWLKREEELKEEWNNPP
ncbi:transcription factor IIIA-like isoform X2 [Ischnura elegans]|uniref:transcription factor IIIA-like isoform X2 n=1 Tax=Ischnura elegans TaxID=197161 RepID=UPI001ED8AE36|nr:transcription factor IIIA-like isoform X2 [Ischnura elegans]